MGGIGSGRTDGRPLVSCCCSLDINQLRRDGWLEPGWRGGLQWARDGVDVVSIMVRSEADRLHLAYRVRSGRGGRWEEIEEAVSIVRVPCRFGGSRPFFVCPGVVDGVSCRRRAVKIYGAGRFFLCRHCYGLAYKSQREQPYERVLRRIRKVRAQLGGDGNVLSSFPDRPKGMHRCTYERLWLAATAAEMMMMKNLAMRLGRLTRVKS